MGRETAVVWRTCFYRDSVREKEPMLQGTKQVEKKIRLWL